MLEGILPFTKRETDMRAVKQPRNTRISVITGNPDEVRAASRQCSMLAQVSQR